MRKERHVVKSSRSRTLASGGPCRSQVSGGPFPRSRAPEVVAVRRTAAARAEWGATISSASRPTGMMDDNKRNSNVVQVQRRPIGGLTTFLTYPCTLFGLGFDICRGLQ